MGRTAKAPLALVAPVSSKKQLLGQKGVCAFLGDISVDSLYKLRRDPGERFPKPLQMLNSTPMWSVEQLEKYVQRKEKEVESL